MSELIANPGTVIAYPSETVWDLRERISRGHYYTSLKNLFFNEVELKDEDAYLSQYISGSMGGGRERFCSKTQL